MALIPPSGFAAEASGLTRAMLTWTPGGGDETGIVVQLGAAEEGPFYSLAALSPSATKLEVGGLPPDTDVWCRAVATDGAGNLSLPTAAKKVRPSVAAAIRYELLLPTTGGARRPLPLVSHWAIQPPNFDPSVGWGPNWQLARITEDSVLFAPCIGFPIAQHLLDSPTPQWTAHAQAMLEWCAENDVPPALNVNQFTNIFVFGLYGFGSLPIAQSPFCLSQSDGGATILAGDRVDPQGPIEHFQTIGQLHGACEHLALFQEWCPNPKLVILVDNNEPGLLDPENAHLSYRYVQLYGGATTDEEKRTNVFNDWVERWHAMRDAFKAELTPAWQVVLRHIGYGGYGGRGALDNYLGAIPWGTHHSTYTDTPTRQINRAAELNDGCCQDVYNRPSTPWGYELVSGPQFVGGLWRPAIDEILAENPNFHFEFSVWPGASADITASAVNPDVYEGHLRLISWLVREVRVFREYRGVASQIHEVEDPNGVTNQLYWDRVVKVSREVHANSTLRYFWEHGTLVPNTATSFPATLIAQLPASYPDPDQLWFHHDNNLDPDWGTATRTTKVPVTSVVLLDPNTEAPNRRWLVVAYATRGDRTGVEISHADWPGGKITLDVPEAGTVVLVDETLGLLSLPEDDGVPTPLGLTLSPGVGTAIEVGWAAAHGAGYTIEAEVSATEEGFTGEPTATGLDDDGAYSFDPESTGAVYVKIRRRETASGEASDWTDAETMTTESSTETPDVSVSVHNGTVVSVSFEDISGGTQPHYLEQLVGSQWVAIGVGEAGATSIVVDVAPETAAWQQHSVGAQPGAAQRFRVPNLQPGTEYVAQVRGRNEHGASEFCGLFDGRTDDPAPRRPERPRNVRGEVFGGTAARVRFVDAASNETAFRVERNLDDGGYETLVTLGPSPGVSRELQVVDTGLAEGSVAAYRIVALAGSLESLPSDEVTVTIPASTGAPTAPSDLSAVPVGPEVIALSWQDNSDDESGFEIERSTTGGGADFTLIETTPPNATAFVDSGLAAETEYFYRVRAVNDSGDSAYSEEASATTPADGASVVTPATNLRLRALSATSVSATWIAPGGDILEQQLHRREVGEEEYSLVATLPPGVNSHVDTTASADTGYDYLVRAVGTDGTEADSDPETVRTPRLDGGVGRQPTRSERPRFVRQFDKDDGSVTIYTAETDADVTAVAMMTDDADNGPFASLQIAGQTVAVMVPGQGFLATGGYVLRAGESITASFSGTGTGRGILLVQVVAR